MCWWPFKRPVPRSDYHGVHARVEAEAALEQAKAQRASVHVVSTSLRRLNDENHYAERIAALIKGNSG